MEKKPATIKEIARRLQVSVSTVSRALHNHPSIGLRTRTRVQQLAAELNYEPNLAAVSFKSGRTMTLGVILPSLGEEFFSMAVNGIEEVATRNGYTVLLGQSHDQAEKEKQIVETMRRHRVDGIIVSLAKTTRDYTHFQELEKYQIPVVFFDRVPDWEQSFTVTCDLQESSVQLVEWLIEQGHRRIGFIRGPQPIVHARDRLQGYQRALEKHRIKYDSALVVPTDLTRSRTQDAMHKLLALRQRPTAVVAFNDYVALDAMQYARQQGIKINRDIVFVSYANLPVTHYLDQPPQASVEQYPFEQAEKATTLLLQRIQKDPALDEKPCHIRLESRVVVREKD